MYILKGFCTNSRFITNNGSISSIGELSTLALTYSTNKGSYKADSINNDIELITFTSSNEVITNGAVTGSVVYELDQTVVNDVITIINHIYSTSIAANGVIYSDLLLNDLLTTYSNIATNFSSGNIINNGANWIPEWISFESKNRHINANGNLIKIWFSDNSFRLQYDDYLITIVPPITPLDNFFMPSSDVMIYVNNNTIPNMMSNIQNSKNNNPETIIVGEVFNYHDPVVSGNLIPTVWNVLIYGIAGNGIDIIKEALRKYILANSTHSRDDWVKIFPDIFKNTEFTIIPEWNNYAIPNRTLEAGIYSPISNISSSLTLLNNTVGNYPTTHINSNATMMDQPYKSLGLLIIGSPDNVNNKFKITDYFGDYINVSSTSADFSRMSLDTQTWSIMLEQMIITAESMGLNTPIPVGMTRVIRNNILYVVSNYNNIDYLVAAKSSF